MFGKRLSLPATDASGIVCLIMKLVLQMMLHTSAGMLSKVLQMCTSILIRRHTWYLTELTLAFCRETHSVQLECGSCSNTIQRLAAYGRYHEQTFMLGSNHSQRFFYMFQVAAAIVACQTTTHSVVHSHGRRMLKPVSCPCP